MLRKQTFHNSGLPKSGIPIEAALCFRHGYGGTCTLALG